MDVLNVATRKDGTRVETHREGTRSTTTITKACGCTTTTFYDSRPHVGGSGHSGSTCSKHRILSWNAA